MVRTSNTSNKVMAVAADENATIEISKGIATIENGAQVTWDDGRNVLTVKVTNGSASQTYTVTVNKGMK